MRQCLWEVTWEEESEVSPGLRALCHSTFTIGPLERLRSQWTVALRLSWPGSASLELNFYPLALSKALHPASLPLIDTSSTRVSRLPPWALKQGGVHFTYWTKNSSVTLCKSELHCCVSLAHSAFQSRRLEHAGHYRPTPIAPLPSPHCIRSHTPCVSLIKRDVDFPSLTPTVREIDLIREQIRRM